MSKRYVISLCKNEVGSVSYFPGFEIRNNPDVDWIKEILEPAVRPILERKDKKIRELPITFWGTIRGTARRKAEIFLFTTPPNPGARITEALNQALTSISGGKVMAGIEHIPSFSFPLIQLFRNKLIRFYLTVEGYPGYHLPIINWQDGVPTLDLSQVPEASITVENLGVDRVMVRAQVEDIMSGEYNRNFQMNLIPIAREDRIETE